MTAINVDEFVRRAEEIYTTRLRGFLESEHIDDFVAIEPESGDYFLERRPFGRLIQCLEGLTRRRDRAALRDRRNNEDFLHRLGRFGSSFQSDYWNADVI